MGQDRGAVDAQAAKTRNSRVAEEGPTLYYLKDKDGKLVLVPGVSFETFIEVHNHKIGLSQRNRRPEHVLQRMMVHGSVKGENAELTIELTIQARDAGWVQVPLHFDQGVLLQTQYRGPGEHTLTLETEGDGHVVWLRGPENGQHNLTLKMMVPILQAGEGSRLQLSLPRAATSELKLNVPVAKAAAKVSDGATLLPPGERGGSTEFRVLGAAGNFELTYHKAAGRAAKMQTVLDVEGMILTRIEDRGINTTATLRVESYGAPFDRFLVRLPPGAQLTPGTPSDYTIVPMQPREKTTPPQRVVEVRLSKKTSGPVEVQLNTRFVHNMTKPKEEFELAGFEVDNAARQSGYIAVASPGDRQIVWRTTEGVRQVDQLPELLRNKDVCAGFEYYAQPFSLKAQLVAKKTRVAVDPVYILSVDANRALLQGTLKYTVRGAKISELLLAFPRDKATPDWELDEIGPETLITVDGVTIDDAQEKFRFVTIPLQQPWGGSFELKLRAHRRIAEDAKSLSLPLPRPRDCSLGTADIVVLPADNVQLIPNAQAIKGLIRQRVAPKMELPARQQLPLFYRGETVDTVFVADFEILPRRVDVDVTSRLRVESKSVAVTQTLSYAIAHEAIDAITIRVPKTLADPRKLQLQYKGTSLSPVAINVESADSSEEKLPGTPMRVLLPESCIGSCDITVAYSIPIDLQPNDPVKLGVPLVMPQFGTLTGNEVLVASGRNITAEPAIAPWTLLESNGNGGTQHLAADRPVNQVDLTATLAPSEDRGSTVVERAWIQTWLTRSERRDRSAFLFTSSRDKIRLAIPAGAKVDAMQVYLDGAAVVVKSEERGRLTIPLPNGSTSEGKRYRLEVYTHFPTESRSPGSARLDLVHLEPDVWTRRVYWQLVLPKNEHILSSPDGFIGEYRWSWDEYFWGRKPLLGQADLESWVGVPPQSPVAQRANVYLFSGVGSAQRCQLRTTSRTWIVLTASGLVLVAGLLLMYVPLCRHPVALLVLAVALLSMGVFYPEVMLMTVQAAVVGLVLVLVAWFLQRNIPRRRRSVSAPEVTSSIVARESTQTQYQAPIPINPMASEADPFSAGPTSDSSP